MRTQKNIKKKSRTLDSKVTILAMVLVLSLFQMVQALEWERIFGGESPGIKITDERPVCWFSPIDYEIEEPYTFKASNLRFDSLDGVLEYYAKGTGLGGTYHYSVHLYETKYNHLSQTTAFKEDRYYPASENAYHIEISDVSYDSSGIVEDSYSASVSPTDPPPPNPPEKAANPIPGNSQRDLRVTTTLSWSDGGNSDSRATSYDIYLSTDRVLLTNPDLDDSEFKGSQIGTVYDPNTLLYGTTYFWRIDAKNMEGIQTGDIWSFTTVPAPNGSGPHAATITVDASGLGDFSSIQAAIDSARNFDKIVVNPGVYYENIDFKSKAITVTSVDPNDPKIVAGTIIDANGIGNVASFLRGEISYSRLLGMSLANGYSGVYCKDNNCRPHIESCLIRLNDNGVHGGAPTVVRCVITENKLRGVYCDRSMPVIANSIISGNLDFGIYCTNWSDTAVRNCTIVGNKRSGIYNDEHSDVTVANCIIAWNQGYGFFTAFFSGTSVLKYNNFYYNGDGDYNNYAVPGEGDIYEYPWFAMNGYWDEDEVWHDDGDYHLLSTNGRWDPIAELWVTDAIDSPCLNRGDPNSPIGDEPMPNGGRINMGAYGGTLEASMSAGPACTEYPVMDFNRDCKVDQADLDLFMEHWLECNLDPPEACWEE